MRLLRFGRRVINASALLEAVPSSDGTKLYLWMAGPGVGEEPAFMTSLEGDELEAFWLWLEDNSDLVAGIAPAPAAPADLDPDDGHDTSIPF